MDNCNTNCIYRNYSVEIFYGVNVLKNHLNKNYNIEYFMDRIENMKIIYLDETIIQCITKENNVAISFQDGNIH